MSAVTLIRTQVCELPITVFAFETQESLGITRPWPISKHSTKQQAKTTIVKACIVNEFDGFIHLDMIVINASASKID